ncbi:hypothetical protein GZ77_20410 [Endozoicomonas montiporae]|uniref:Phytase-like domain-containing protein n=2 Tax=Endozoicomonas montiporae TaxID=1027273 RepID=A0A081N2Z5_9GAMM|nr:esterase-like activity of phytase family protein [Endozoicomonas montiporae]AMO58089.1 3-phytase, Glycerophosphodiester phosphodiesterase [Endozoicomonas montiporae CL-33]KEQ12818.1 hypothetical protein GZ77_20410 [Endozoicomonas montiporae]
MKKFVWLLPLLLLPRVYAANLASSHKSYDYLGTVLIGNTEDQPVLGISSIRYDAKTDQFFLVSDDTGTIPNRYGQLAKPRYYTISGKAVTSVLNPQPHQLSPSFVNEVQLTVSPDESQWTSRKNWIQDGHVDTEGLALFNNSPDLLIASEQGATYPIKTYRMNQIWDVYNMIRIPDVDVVASLLVVDRHLGLLKRRYYFPTYYQTSLTRSTLKYISPQRFMKAYDAITGEDMGLQRNRGVESIDFIPGTNDLIAITEMPLRQDIKPWKANHKTPPPSRIIHLSLDEFRDEGYRFYPKVQKELLYGVAEMPDEYTQNTKATIKTGVSDIVALSASQLLVVERTRITFDSDKDDNQQDKPVSITEIYRADLDLDPKYHVTTKPRLTAEEMKNKRVVKKHLVFSTLEASAQDVFENMNIEGITFGPEFNGRKTIVLVNDNDAAEGKDTKLIFLAAD